MVQARAEATRSAVFRAGAVVFNREGFAGARTTDITREAAVTNGAMQFHFRTKEDLALAVIAEYTRDFEPAITSIPTHHDSGLIAAMELSAAIARQLVEEPIVGAAYRLRMEESAFRPRVTRPYVEAVGVFDELFQRAANAGDLRLGLNTNDVARYVVASFIGVQLVSDTLTSRTDLIQRAADMWVFLLPSITIPSRLRQQLEAARRIFVTHYTKSRSDLAAN